LEYEDISDAGRERCYDAAELMKMQAKKPGVPSQQSSGMRKDNNQCVLESHRTYVKCRSDQTSAHEDGRVGCTFNLAVTPGLTRVEIIYHTESSQDAKLFAWPSAKNAIQKGMEMINSGKKAEAKTVFEDESIKENKVEWGISESFFNATTTLTDVGIVWIAHTCEEAIDSNWGIWSTACLDVGDNFDIYKICVKSV